MNSRRCRVAERRPEGDPLSPSGDVQRTLPPARRTRGLTLTLRTTARRRTAWWRRWTSSLRQRHLRIRCVERVEKRSCHTPHQLQATREVSSHAQRYCFSHIGRVLLGGHWAVSKRAGGKDRRSWTFRKGIQALMASLIARTR
jgi:hypothetical protein